jgi:hypothetical protein
MWGCSQSGRLVFQCRRGGVTKGDFVKSCTIIFSALLFTFSAGAANQCIDIFTKKLENYVADPSVAAVKNTALETLLQAAAEDPYLRQTLLYVEGELRTAQLIESPINISRKNNNYRKQILPLLSVEPVYREAAVRFMESDLRVRSTLATEKLATSKNAQYDVVIVGAGVHGVIALNALLRQNPKLKVLVVEQTDTAGATFRYPDNAFRINSSNRPSSDDVLPLPGRGNINELPQLPIQVSDLSAAKYPTAGDLGTALVSGLHSVVSNSKTVDIIFQSSVTNFSSKAFQVKNSDSPFLVEGVLSNNKSFSLSASTVVLATGLGAPKIPESVRKRLRPEMVTAKNPYVELPKVITFENIMRLIGQSPTPRALLAGKKIAVVGVGDSANVFIEFLLGYAAERGYGYSNGQTPPPAKIFWIGQQLKNCEDFIAEARSRYAQIGTGFRSSDPKGESIIEPFPERLEQINLNRNKELVVTLEGKKEKVRPDLVILATGFEGQLFKLFSEFYRVAGDSTPKNDRELMEQYFSDVMGVTKVTGGQETVIGRELKWIEDGQLLVPSEKNSAPRIVAVGPGAGKLPKDQELFGIIQNTVSIFNNALRTAAVAQRVGKTLNSKINEGFLEQKGIAMVKRNSQFAIKDIQESRPLGSATELYLQATLINALQYSAFRDSEALNITFGRDSRGIVVSSNYDIYPLLFLLAQTRDFFATMESILNTTGGKAVVWQMNAPIRDFNASDITFELTNKPTNFLLNKDLVEINNQTLPLDAVM